MFCVSFAINVNSTLFQRISFVEIPLDFNVDGFNVDQRYVLLGMSCKRSMISLVRLKQAV